MITRKRRQIEFGKKRQSLECIVVGMRTMMVPGSVVSSTRGDIYKIGLFLRPSTGKRKRAGRRCVCILESSNILKLNYGYHKQR